jgi:uncharacterized protein (TIGR02646 family)
MKCVAKRMSPQSFEDWKLLANSEWQPRYSNLQTPQKQALHEALLSEQGWVCCYCGRPVGLRDSHIEHFHPQERHVDLALSYDNLHASCIRETAPGIPLHCGHAKGEHLDEALCISPLDPCCEERFVYALDGSIQTRTVVDSGARYMIDLLKLDIAFLRNRRGDAVRRVFDPTFLATTTTDELVALRDFYRRWDDQGRATGFGHVLARFAEQRLDDKIPSR